MKKRGILILIIAVITVVLSVGTSVLCGGFTIWALGNYASRLFNAGYKITEVKSVIASVWIHVAIIAWHIIAGKKKG